MASIKYLFFLCVIAVLPLRTYASPTTEPIIGGEFTDLTNTPIALIQTFSGYQCTGTLIAQNLILTAAHCISPYGPADYVVSVGGFTYPVVQAWYHGNYNQAGDASPANSQYDLGMLQLGGIVTSVNPVRVLVDDRVNPAEQALILGFGTNEISGIIDGSIGKVGTVVIQPSQTGVLESSFYFSNAATCQGDSGGPLIQIDSYYPKALLVGVISYGSNLNIAGFCVASGAGHSGFVDLQSNTSQYFLSFFAGIEYVSGYAIYVGKVATYVQAESKKASRIANTLKRNKKISSLIKAVNNAKRFSYGARLKYIKSSLSGLKAALLAKTSKDAKKSLNKVGKSLNAIQGLGFI